MVDEIISRLGTAEEKNISEPEVIAIQFKFKFKMRHREKKYGTYNAQ